MVKPGGKTRRSEHDQRVPHGFTMSPPDCGGREAGGRFTVGAWRGPVLVGGGAAEALTVALSELVGVGGVDADGVADAVGCAEAIAAAVGDAVVTVADEDSGAAD